MLSQNGALTKPTSVGTDGATTVELVGTFLLRVARYERDGLSHNSAVLAAASAMGTDPGAVLRATGEDSA